MPDLLIRLKSHADGSASLTCVRRDGSTTWQRQRGQLGTVFPPHDLTHYAVETALGYARGFYGLIVEGWDIGDFAAPWPRGPVPEEAREVELIVGCFDTERRVGRHWTVAEFNEHQARYASSQRYGAAQPPRALTDDELSRVRALRADVFAQWAAIAPGGTLKLSFDRGVGRRG